MSKSDFLRIYRAELERRCLAHMDEADAYDDEGAHFGLARHRRALADGLNEAILTLDEMWRAETRPPDARLSELNPPDFVVPVAPLAGGLAETPDSEIHDYSDHPDYPEAES